RSQLSRFLEIGILLLAIVVCIALSLLDRKERAYRWLGITCAAIAFSLLVTLLGNYTTVLPGWLNFLLADAVLTPLVIALWIVFWAYWFRMGRMQRMHYMVWGFTIGLSLTIAMLRAPLYGHLIPMQWVIVLTPLAVF